MSIDKDSQQIIYEILGERYILVELLVSPKISENVNELIAKYDCIYQGIKTIDRGGFFDNAVIVAKYLVPEKNIIQFSKEY